VRKHQIAEHSCRDLERFDFRRLRDSRILEMDVNALIEAVDLCASLNKLVRLHVSSSNRRHADLAWNKLKHLTGGLLPKRNHRHTLA
jgi:hypothetical protein